MASDKRAIPPYWTQFGSFFLYPLRGKSLLVCIGCGLLAGLASLWFFLGLISVALAIFLLVVMLRYGYGVLERTARGHLGDDPVFLESSHGWTPYKQFVVIAVGGAASLFVGGIVSPHVAIVLLALFFMLLPANIMTLAMTESLVESISPSHLWGVAHGIGLPYLGLCACLHLLSISNVVLLGLLLPMVPMAFVMVVTGFVNAYFMIVMFRLMGYTLYQYHEALGFAIDAGHQGMAVSKEDSAKQATEHFAMLIKEGHFDEAITLTKEEIAHNPDDVGANQRLHRLLLALPDRQAAMLEHAIRWLPLLLHKKHNKEAAEVLETVWKYQPDLMPTVATHILPLAQAYFEMHHFKSATRLIKGFDRRFPGHQDIPAVYLLGARLMIEYKRDEAGARRVLSTVLARYPDSSSAPEAAKLLNLLDRLQESAK
jgi:tetratricopeptide (TPR) repeat protein